jgi:hypothetical protein
MSITRCECCERPVDTDLNRIYEVCERCVDSLDDPAPTPIDTINDDLMEVLETIAGFAAGNGDVCEIIARRARAALAKARGQS